MTHVGIRFIVGKNKFLILIVFKNAEKHSKYNKTLIISSKKALKASINKKS